MAGALPPACCVPEPAMLLPAMHLSLPLCVCTVPVLCLSLPGCACCGPAREGTDFQQLIDLAGLYRVWNDKYKSWSVFGQDHLAKVLLGWDPDASGHDAVK